MYSDRGSHLTWNSDTIVEIEKLKILTLWTPSTTNCCCKLMHKLLHVKCLLKVICKFQFYDYPWKKD